MELFGNGAKIRGFQPRSGDDRVYPGVVNLDYNHQLAHDGEVNEISLVSTSVTQNNSLDMLLVTGGRAPHLLYSVSAGATTRIFLYELPTATVLGTEIPIYNVNRVKALAFGLKAYSAPTVTVVGTPLNDRLNPGGSGGNAVGGNLRRGVEYILRPDTAYLIRATNISTGATQIGIGVEFYEPG